MRFNLSKTEHFNRHERDGDGDQHIILTPSPEEKLQGPATIAATGAKLAEAGKNGNDLVEMERQLQADREALFAELASAVEDIASRLYKNKMALDEVARVQVSGKRRF